MNLAFNASTCSDHLQNFLLLLNCQNLWSLPTMDLPEGVA